MQRKGFTFPPHHLPFSHCCLRMSHVFSTVICPWMGLKSKGLNVNCYKTGTLRKREKQRGNAVFPLCFTFLLFYLYRCTVRTSSAEPRACARSGRTIHQTSSIIHQTSPLVCRNILRSLHASNGSFGGCKPLVWRLQTVRIQPSRERRKFGGRGTAPL